MKKADTRSLPVPIYRAPGGLRQDPGRAAELPTEARYYGRGVRNARLNVDEWGARGSRSGSWTRRAVADSRHAGASVGAAGLRGG